MKETIEIVDNGRGPQLSSKRLTVMDIFYYIHRGRDFEYIHRAMPGLTREEFDAVVIYVNEHLDELAGEDRDIEEQIQREIAEQRAKGFAHDIDHSAPPEVRAARLKERFRHRFAEPSEKNGHTPR